MTAALPSKRRGEPLVVLIAVIGLWAVTRAVLWQSPFPMAFDLPEIAELAASRIDISKRPDADRVELAAVPLTTHSRTTGAHLTQADPVLFVIRRQASTTPTFAGQVELFSGHQIMWIAAMAGIPVPAEIATLMRRAEPAPRGNFPATYGLTAAGQSSDRDRWSLAGWSLYRPNSPGLPRAGQGSLPASYGSSQAGAVLSYRLAPTNPRDPALYLRTTQALAGSRESEIALGLSGRPFPQVPVRTQAEARLLRSGGRSDLRPALFAVTEFPRANLPLGLRADSYVQAGYVGGRFATPFVDAQARVTREIVDFDLVKLDAGAGAWGGAQEGAARLDLGPTAGLNLTIGEVPARLSVDYRQRIAGNAAPQSGMAVTLSTSF